jgi:hypothetical protein
MIAHLIDSRRRGRRSAAEATGPEDLVPVASHGDVGADGSLAAGAAVETMRSEA